jgi:hypothetical protein
MLSQPHRLVGDVPVLLLCELEFADGVFERLVTARSRLLDLLIDFTPSVFQFDQFFLKP